MSSLRVPNSIPSYNGAVDLHLPRKGGRDTVYREEILVWSLLSGYEVVLVATDDTAKEATVTSPISYALFWNWKQLQVEVSNEKNKVKCTTTKRI